MTFLNESTLCGIMIGDGCLEGPTKTKRSYRAIITLNKNEKSHMFGKIKLFFNELDPTAKVRSYNREKYNAIEIRVGSKKLYEYIVKEWNFPIGKKLNIIIPDKFTKSWRSFKNVISGIVATDGCFILSKQHRNIPYYLRVEIANNSTILLDQIAGILRKRNYKLSRWSNRLSIHGFASVRRFKNEIGFINPKHIRQYNCLGA